MWCEKTTKSTSGRTTLFPHRHLHTCANKDPHERSLRTRARRLPRPGWGRRRSQLRPRGRESRIGPGPHQAPALGGLHAVRPGRRRLGARPRRRLRPPHPGHARRRRGALPARGGGGHRPRGAGADPLVDLAGRGARSRGPGSTPPDARGRPLAPPRRAREGHHRARDRARAPRRLRGARHPHRGGPRRGRSRHEREGGARRAEPRARRVRAPPRHGRHHHRLRGRDHPRDGRRGQGLPLHLEPRRRDRRRRGDGVPRGRRHREHGVLPVPPDLPLPPAGEELPHQRGAPRRGRHPAQRRRRGVHVALRRRARSSRPATSSRARSTQR